MQNHSLLQKTYVININEKIPLADLFTLVAGCESNNESSAAINNVGVR